ncbi:MAG: NADH-quinone oxidoreductase subunit L, partial [Gammaproteobacteria bacterium]|nr:NADH-quinone oxidoreductase subunit L [Gammaproteobacteria bacterium]
MSAATVSRLGWLALVPASLCAGAGALFAAGRLPLLITLPWVPAAGAELTLHVDALALLFVLLITGIGTFVFVYAAGYSADDPGRRRLFALLLVFMVAMIGCVT